MLWDGDISFPATAKAGCCLNVSFPVAILISEIKNLKYNMLNLEKEGSGMFEVFTIIPIFLPDHISPWFHCRLRHQAHKELYAYKQVR